MKPYTIVVRFDCLDNDDANEVRDEIGGAAEGARDSNEPVEFSYNGSELFKGDLLWDYQQLHDMLSDMLEGGRLKQTDIPDDYDALVRQLALLANRDL